MDRKHLIDMLKQKKKVLILSVTGLVVVASLGFVSTRLLGKKTVETVSAHGSKHEDRHVASHDGAQVADAEDSDGDDEDDDTMQAESPDSETHAPQHVKQHAEPKHHDQAEKSEHVSEQKPGIFSSFMNTYGQAFVSLQDKVDILRKALEENERLKLENANLRVQTEGLRFSCKTKEAEDQAGRLEAKLSEETGTRVGRTLAGIEYRPPAHLLPEQLFTLGVGYFKAHEDEKAVVILSFLTSMDDDGAYKTPQNFLMTGVAWYRLDNVKLADEYFDKALGTPAEGENLQYHAQARLWRALAAQKINNHTLSQNWLRELVDHHPKSTEASWINGNKNPITSGESLTTHEGERLPASAHSSKSDEEHAE